MSFVRTIRSRGNKYQQLVESRWDPKRKQSRIHVIRHMGKIIEKDGTNTLIPSQLKIDTLDKVYPLGKLALLWKIAEEFKIRKCISSVLNESESDTATSILILVLNQLVGRKPLTKIGTWISETPLPRWIDINVEELTKDKLLSSLDRVCEKNADCDVLYSYAIQDKLTASWRKIIGNEPERYLFFQDVTRIRWNGSQSYWAENGYGNQKGRPHIGFGLVVSGKNYMPVMGYPVRGSHHDSTTFSMAVDNFRRRDMENIIFVYDRGFVSKANVGYARKKQYQILSAGSETSNEVIERITKYADSEIEKRENILGMSKGRGVYYVEQEGTLYGHECKIVVMLDPEKRSHSRTQRDMLLHELEIETSSKKVAKLKKYLNPIVKPAKGRKGYKIDIVEEERARNTDGRTLFFCTDTNMPGREIIQTYFQKDNIEKAFRFLRGNACLSPVKYQLPGRIEGYLSVISFIAYELIAAINWKINQNALGLSYDELMEEASKIYEVEFTSKNNKIHRWTHIKKDSERLFKPFNLFSLKPSY